VTSTPHRRGSLRRGLRSRVVRVGALLSAVVLLAGCGDARPGVAAEVGDQTISISDVDSASVAFCAAYGDVNPGSIVPMRVARSFLLANMMNRSMGEQIATEYDVQPGADFEKSVADARASISQLPADQQEAILEQQTATPYQQAVLHAAARRLLAREGVVNPTTDQLTTRVTLLQTQWIDSHALDVDPRFSLTVDNGAVTSSNAEALGFPLSETAKDGEQDDPQALGTIAESLPVSQQCGA
jgi:hypothetical protein